MYYQSSVEPSNQGQKAILCGRRVISKPKCNCGETSLFLCDKVLDNNILNYKLCSKELCRACAIRWFGGVDYCKEHIPDVKVGAITIGNVKDGHREEDIYIGRSVGLAGYAASPLGNPFKLSKVLVGNEHEEAQRVLEDYKKWLWHQIKTKTEAYHELIRLRDFLLRGEDLTLLCWCKRRDREVPCHGDIVKACLEWMIGRFLEAKNQLT
jgi:Domain of unknown function (DUF4326)